MNLAKRIRHELKEHASFTALGAVSGIILMFVFRNMPEATAERLFYVFHPAHVFLSAIATAGMYQNYQCRLDRKQCNLWFILAIGCIGSIGIATLSDSVIPHLGELLLGMPHAHAHIGFIEAWWLVIPAAVIGTAIAYFRPHTRQPHYGHVLLSTWASLFHIIMAKGEGMAWYIYLGALIFLFLAVWLPCCISDIVFPLLFVTKQDGANNSD